MLRGLRGQAFAVATLAGISIAGCDDAKPSPAASSSAEAESALKQLAASVAASGPRRSVDALVTPPLVPPASARQGAEGVSWQLLKEGSGAPVGEGDSVQAELSVWTTDGKLAFSSYQKDGPIAFSAAVIPSVIFQELRNVSPGGKAWFWFSAERIHRIAQERHYFPYPDAALVMEYEVVSVIASTAGGSSARVATAAFQPPDAAGPPTNARSTPSGLRHVSLRAGTGTAKPTASNKLQLLLTVWPVTGLVVGPPAARDLASATTLARAPAGLDQVLQGMTEGAVERVWLPAGKASQVAPLPKEQQAVLDLTLQQIE